MASPASQTWKIPSLFFNLALTIKMNRTNKKDMKSPAPNSKDNPWVSNTRPNHIPPCYMMFSLSTKVKVDLKIFLS